MAKPVFLPQLGLSTTSARIVEWLVAVGQEVKSGQAIAEVETDKATVEIPAPESGYITGILVEAGMEAGMGDPIATIGDTAEDSALGAAADVAPYQGGHSTASVAAHPAAGARAYPAARRRAAELGVKLEGLSGTGPGGTVTVGDVEAAAPPAGGTSDGTSSMRAAVARTVERSWTIPQFWLERTLSTTAVENAIQAWPGEAKPTFIDFLIRACATALRQHTRLRSQPVREGVAVGYAVANEDGMLVPVVTNADRGPLEELARRRREVVADALSGRLGVNGAAEAEFTISNLGALGIDRFMALVMPGQIGILAVGRIDGESHRVTVVLTLDHRAADGADGARFLESVAAWLQAPHDSDA